LGEDIMSDAIETERPFDAEVGRFFGFVVDWFY
jgi:hypothetical protein